MLIDKINAISDDIEEHYLAVRHDLHAHPELSYKEFRTSEKVQEELKRLGIPFELSPVKPGVIATIDSGKPGKLLLLRADMDALPIQECSGVPFSSENPGVMHACGHDVHTTNLLAVCEILVRTRELWSGRVKAVFQPAEENGGGGREMIKAGLMEEEPDACMGMHVGAWTPGVFDIGEGYVSAYSDAAYITVHGKAVHSSKPEHGVDAVLIAASIVLALNTIVSRNLSPMAKSTLNVGTIHGGTAVNIVTDKVEIGAMLRNADPESREIMFQKIEQIARGVAEGMGGRIDFRRHNGYSSVYNDPAMTRFVIDTIRKNQEQLYTGIGPVPEGNIRTGERMQLGAEDFGFYSHEAPSCFIKVGTGGPALNHTPDFKVDDHYIKLMARTMALAAEQFLQ
ncbi:M20 family metallopeptidase [Acidaminococcus timonensis]|uniref:M20 metallopeptidase family protein n=1 Tax=Acidaminococcus timonensis TaxID=1871002 RepID=UPI00307D1B21